MITWEYLAGFFDGEGCVNYANSGSQRTYRIRLTFSQSRKRGYELLFKIKAFLEKEKCKLGKIYTSGYIKDIEKNSTKKIMEALLPYLEIKKLEVQDALRRQILFPSFVGRTRQ